MLRLLRPSSKRGHAHTSHSAPTPLGPGVGSRLASQPQHRHAGYSLCLRHNSQHDTNYRTRRHARTELWHAATHCISAAWCTQPRGECIRHAASTLRGLSTHHGTRERSAGAREEASARSSLARSRGPRSRRCRACPRNGTHARSVAIGSRNRHDESTQSREKWRLLRGGGSLKGHRASPSPRLPRPRRGSRACEESRRPMKQRGRAASAARRLVPLPPR